MNEKLEQLCQLLALAHLLAAEPEPDPRQPALLEVPAITPSAGADPLAELIVVHASGRVEVLA